MEETSIRIIHSAIELFANKGFYETKVDEIAEKSNVAKGTIYLYFKSKEEILNKSIEYITDKTTKNYEVDENLTFTENLKMIIDKNVEFVKNNISFFKVMFKNTYEVNRDNIRNSRCNMSAIISEITKLVEIGKKENIVRKDISSINLSIFISNILFSSLMTIVMSIINNYIIKIPIEELKEDLYKFILNGIRGELWEKKQWF